MLIFKEGFKLLTKGWFEIKCDTGMSFIHINAGHLA